MIFRQEVTELIRIATTDFFAIRHFAKSSMAMHWGTRKLPDLLICLRNFVPHLFVPHEVNIF